MLLYVEVFDLKCTTSKTFFYNVLIDIGSLVEYLMVSWRSADLVEPGAIHFVELYKVIYVKFSYVLNIIVVHSRVIFSELLCNFFQNNFG